MKINLFTVAAGIALLATSVTASAQKVYKEGVITYTVSAAGMPGGDAKTYFKGDSSVTVTQTGPATIKVISVGVIDYLAVLVDVPVASMKNAAALTPAELEEASGQLPELTFTPTTETKTISGFNCKKVTCKDPKTNAGFDVWITNDISAPVNGISQFYKKVGGFPVQFTTYQRGAVVNALVKSISDEKVPAGLFKIPADYKVMSMADLQAMSGGRK
jgi:hypothetical protein